jgi:hypothetical protein
MYGKLFASIFDGSLYGHFPGTVVMMALIALADERGEVDMTPEKLAAATAFPLDIVRAGIEYLSQPDPRSRSREMEGRRIVLIDPERSWGWRLVNHAKYRAIRSEENRREYMRDYMRTKRTAANTNRHDANNVYGKQELAKLAHTEAEALNTLAPSVNTFVNSVSSTRSTPSDRESVSADSSACANRPESLTLANDETDIPHIVARLQLVDGTEYGISDAQVAEWRAAYPAVDVLAELARMRVWIGAHAARRKTRRGIAKFAVAWLSRAQDAPRPQLAPRAEQAQPPAKWD